MKKKDSFLKAFENCQGNISRACKCVRITRQTYYDWREKDEEFKAKCESIEESLLDEGESALKQRMESGDTTAIIFYLKTKGKKRGYTEKKEVEMSGSLPLAVPKELFDKL